MEIKKEFTAEKIIKENWIHCIDVARELHVLAKEITTRSAEHDKDKFVIENAEVLANALNTNEWEKWTELHLQKQRHHDNWIRNIDSNPTLLDVLEMVVDGCVANLRRTGIEKTREEEIEYFAHRGFGYGLLNQLLVNTFMQVQESFKDRLELEKR